MTRFDNAVQFAVNAHSGMTRKGTVVPFILHPMESAAIASSITTDEDVIIAALLHDTVEDARVDPEKIREAFGGRVLSLVLADTEENPGPVVDGDVWDERKNAMIEFLKEKADRDEKIVILSDRLSNLRSILSDKKIMGDAIWEVNHDQTDKYKQHWFYQSVADEMGELAGSTAYDEFISLIEEIFGGGYDY